MDVKTRLDLPVQNGLYKLPSVMRERLVGLRHLVHVFLALHRVAGVVGSVYSVVVLRGYGEGRRRHRIASYFYTVGPGLLQIGAADGLLCGNGTLGTEPGAFDLRDRRKSFGDRRYFLLR